MDEFECEVVLRHEFCSGSVPGSQVVEERCVVGIDVCEFARSQSCAVTLVLIHAPGLNVAVLAIFEGLARELWEGAATITFWNVRASVEERENLIIRVCDVERRVICWVLARYVQWFVVKMLVDELRDGHWMNEILHQ